MTENNNTSSTGKQPLKKVVKSIFAGAIGVQSSKNREEDFQAGSPWPYIIGGLVFTALFIGTLVTIIAFVVPD